MKFMKSFITRVKGKNNRHLWRSILIITLAVLLLATGIILPFLIKKKDKPEPIDVKRSYILADPNKPDPKTLDELLHCEKPDIDTMLKTPAIIEELKAVEALTDIVDSRMAISNLREIDRQLTERLESLSGAEDDTLYYLGEDESGENPSQMRDIINEQKKTVSELKAVTGRLLTPKEYDSLLSLPLNVNMKGVWEEDGDVYIHMTPSGDWIPEEGFKLYRTVNGNKQLLAENIASYDAVYKSSLKIMDKEIAVKLNDDSKLTADKLAILGLDAEAFRNLAYRTDSLTQKSRVSGKLDFEEMYKALITIPGTIEQKIPETDIITNNPIYIQSKSDVLNHAVQKTSVMERFSIVPSVVPKGIDGLLVKPDGQIKFDLAQSILYSRQQILTLSFVNDEFAEMSGFLYKDNVSDMNLPLGTEIVYSVESGGVYKSFLTVECGKELNLSKPRELIGYGMDERVYLRWNQTDNADEKAIISGYYIERKLKGEDEFKVINKEPVVISYILDETDIYFETPVFFEDNLGNGTTAEYRIYSIDIFGRKSEYSDILETTVEKVTPPAMPVIETPAFSEDAGNASVPILDVITLNTGKKGVVLPIFSESLDTTRFVIYRAEAVGTGKFGTPEMLANIKFDNPHHEMPFFTDENSTADLSPNPKPDVNHLQLNGAKHIVLAESNVGYPDLVYFDSDIKKGSTYKYWVAALDLWNNESAWSQSVTVGVPLADMPKLMDDVSISMEIRNLPDYTAEPPGLVYDGLVNYSEAASGQFPPRRAPEGVGTELIKKAESEDSFIGSFIAKEKTSHFLDSTYNNLPEERYFHMLVGVPKEDLLPDGSARVKWTAYSGEGLQGYVVYRVVFTSSSLEEMQNMSKQEIMQLGRWKRINSKPITQNQIVVGNVANNSSDLALFLVCLFPEKINPSDIQVIPVMPYITNSFLDAPEGGFVYVSWQAPNDPQVEYYRVYRSEVSSFKNPVDESKLEWTLVGDRITNNLYSERVDQSFAHYYYYKITTVSHWGVENTNGVISKFRVPSTKPPQTPNLLLPLSRKDGIQVNFSAVSHCSRYEIYRTEIPVIDDIFINEVLKLDSDMLNALFDSKIVIDLPRLSSVVAEAVQPSTNTYISPISKFKTLSLSDYNVVVSKLSALGDLKCINAYNIILDKAGPLALADYSDLSSEMLKRIKWKKVGEVPADEDTTEMIDPATGLLKPLSFIDTTAEYGVVYLYTVQAWNDDNLGSTRPEPVEATTRRNKAFDPIDGLKGEVKNNIPTLSWNTPKMANLTPEKCRQDTVGYIVYRADTADGEFYQVSPLLFDTKWEDTDANPFAYNWYRVKVLDTGGYMSEFSEPVLVKYTFSSELKPFIPPLEEIPKPPIIITAPKITFGQSQYSVSEGFTLSVSYTLTGTDPITVSVKGKNAAGSEIEGFSVDHANRKINVSASLTAGTYTVTATAANSAGQSTVSFTLTVMKRIVVLKAPKLTEREDEYNFTMFRVSNLSVQLSASGTQPLTWTLEPHIERIVPSQISITSNGVLNVDKSIPVGTHSFYVKVSNSIGSDRKLITLKVQNRIKPMSLAVNDLPDVTTDYTSDLMMCMDFRLTNVLLKAFDDFARHGYYGTALLDIGCGELIPVEIKNASFTKDSTSHSDTDIMTWGNVYLKTPFEIESLGIKLISLNISPNKKTAVVSGTMTSTDANKNLFGDLFAFEFRNAELRNGFIIMTENIPDVRYNQFTLFDAQKLWIKLDGMRPDAYYLFSFEGSKVSMKYCLETLNNEELEFEQMSSLLVDMDGNMSGSLYVNREQSLQLLVPGGSALRVEEAVITITKGEVVNGNITGKLVLPFEQGDITDIGVPGSYARGEHPETNEMDDIEKGIINDKVRDILRKSLVHFGETVQQNGLLVCPEDFESQDKCAYIPIFLETWLGKGIVMENSYMTTARITERSLDMEKQRSQALVLTPTAVSVDLDREAYIPRETGSQTPGETEKPFWVGLVIKGGKLALPPQFIQQDGGGVIEFALAEGEMIYDLNGFNYQTYLYNDEGVPADFGDELGGFKDVMVYDCLLDLYSNKVNLEINAEVKVELFQNKWVKVKLYTNKKDNEDGKAGEFLCSVAPTVVEDALANDTDMRIDGGWLKPDGMHINGALILPAKNTAAHEITSDTPLAFSDMLIHPKLNLIQRSYDPERKYGSVTLDKPTNISFNGYTVEVREFDFEYIRTQNSFIKLSMRGAALLADNIPLSKETRDSIILKYSLSLGLPEVIYDETYAILDANFDDCINVVGKLIPKPQQNNESLIEFETSAIEFAFLKQVKNMPVEAFTRFGYDREKERCYYAIGIAPKSGSKSISFGAGEIKDYTGLVAYNMEVGRDELGRFVFPENASQMKNYISSLPVYKGSNSNFAAGVKGTMVVAKLCEIRNMYFGFESGPKVEAGGELYLPLDISAIVGGSAYRKVGSVEMKYRHPDRYFSFSMTLDRINLILATVSGSMGFEYSPSLFGVYLGYPETLVGNISIFHVGAGLGFRIDDNGTSMVQAKMELGLEKDITVSIVYLRGYLYAGVDGSYYFEDATINLELYLKGGLEGGIKVKGKRFNIISFYLDARGSVSSSSPYSLWMLSCSCQVSYSLDLWLFSVEGSVSASFDTKIG